MDKQLIASFELNSTTTGKDVVNLFSAEPPNEYPFTGLFDLSLLETIGIDPNTLVKGQRVWRRIWAYWTEGKLNGKQNPYKDVRALELAVPPAPTPGEGQILAELREIRRLLDHLVVKVEIPGAVRELLQAMELGPVPSSALPAGQAEDHGPKDPPPAASAEQPEPADDPIARYADGKPVSDNAAEVQAYQAYITACNAIPASVEALRKWVADTPKDSRLPSPREVAQKGAAAFRR